MENEKAKERSPMDRADIFFDMFAQSGKISAIADTVLKLLHHHKLTVAEVKAVLNKAREASESIPFQWDHEESKCKPL